MSGITRGHSCSLCQRRKVRCDKQKPCANCVKAKVECTVASSQPRGRRRLAKLPEKALIERLKKYEEFMSQHGLNFGSILDGGDEIRSLNYDPSCANTPSSDNTPTQDQKVDNERNPKWFAYYKEYRTTDDMLHDSSDDESDRPTIHHAFDIMFSDTGGFPFAAGSSPTSITTLHPPGIQIIQLWQVYVNNVNPLLKISHVPLLQVQIVEAAADPSKASRALEALMFAIYFIAVNSMSDEEVQHKSGESKTILLSRYREATEKALINADFMRLADLTVLQGYFLYLATLLQYVDPRSLFCLVGIAVRIATRLGLHRDGAKVGLSPFETEQRRRLWWQIVVLDKRVAKIIGSASTALALPGTDCQLPLNANDADLHSHAKEAPPAPVGATEMNFCLSRIELTMSGEFQRSPMATNDAGSHHGSSSLFNSNPTSQSSPSRLDRYCAYIESTYLKHCDSKIPIQFFTLMMTRLSLCKLRVVNTMSRDSSNLDPNQRDAAFLAAIQMLEYDNIIHSTDSLRGFRWYTTLEMPVSGYTFLANELRNRATDELCDRAWNAIFENHSHRCLGHNLGRLIYFTIGQMLLKAWNACEEADIRAGRVLPSPELIIFLRQRLPRNFSKETPRSDTIDTSSRLESGMPSGPESGQTGMMLDENLMFSSMNGMNIYEPAFPNYDQLEWTNLIQFGGLSETNFNL